MDFEAESLMNYRASDAEFWEYDFINQQIETGDLEDEMNHRVVGKNINSKDGELIVELHNDYQREGLMSWGDEKHPLFNKLVHREYDAESFEAQATHIDWETDGQEVDLPKTVEVPDDLDADEIADYLSDEYGFLVNAFQIKDAESYDAELEDYSPEELTTSNVNVGDFMVDAGKGSYGSEEGYMADWENAPYSSWDDAWSDDVNFPIVEKQEKLWLKNLTTIGVLAGAIYIGRKIKGV